MDDDLFSSILYLVPVALFIFFRFLGGGKKAQASKDRRAREDAARRELTRRVRAETEASGRAVPLYQISGREPEVQDWEPHWVTEQEVPASPAPVAAVPDEEGPEPSQRLTFLETETDLTAFAAPAGSLADFAPSLAGASKPTPREAGAGPSEPYSMSGSVLSGPFPADPSAARAAEGVRAASGPFPDSLEKLPPLKRAVVLAEILGPPKGA